MENRNFTIYNLQSTMYNLFVLGFLGSLLLISGCSGSGNAGDSDMLLRARLIGDENLQLKKDIAAKDKQIADLTKQAEQDKAEWAKQIEQLKQDYELLSRKSAESQQIFDKSVSEYQASLNACQEQLDAKPVPCEEVEAKYAELHGSLLQMLSECASKLEKYEAADPNAK